MTAKRLDDTGRSLNDASADFRSQLEGSGDDDGVTVPVPVSVEVGERVGDAVAVIEQVPEGDEVSDAVPDEVPDADPVADAVPDIDGVDDADAVAVMEPLSLDRILDTEAISERILVGDATNISNTRDINITTPSQQVTNALFLFICAPLENAVLRGLSGRFKPISE